MGFGGDPKGVLVASQMLVARCIGEMGTAVAGVRAISITRSNNNQMADGTCHVLPIVPVVLRLIRCHVSCVLSIETHHLFSHLGWC